MNLQVIEKSSVEKSIVAKVLEADKHFDRYLVRIQNHKLMTYYKIFNFIYRFALTMYEAFFRQGRGTIIYVKQ